MSTHYTTKETALRNIQKRANNSFKLYWRDKDVLLEAAKYGFRLWQAIPN